MSECRGVFGAEKSVSTWWGTDLHMQGSPTSGLQTSVSCLISGGIRLERKCTIHVCLNHPETISMPRSMEKLSSLKSVPGAKKSWGLLFRGYIYFFKFILLRRVLVASCKIFYCGIWALLSQCTNPVTPQQAES